MSTVSPSLESMLDISSLIRNKIHSLTADIANLRKQIRPISELFITPTKEPASTAVFQALQETIGKSVSELDKSVSELEDYLKAQNTIEQEMLLLKDEFLQKIIKIMESILNFQEKLDRLKTDASDKILNYIFYLLVAVMVVYFPIITFILYETNVLEWVKYQFTKENLTDKLASWKEKQEELRAQMKRIETGDNLQEKYQTAEQIKKIANILGCPVLSLVDLKFSLQQFQDLEQVLTTSVRREENLKTFRHLIEEVESLPAHKEGIARMIEKLNHGIVEILHKVKKEGSIIKDAIKIDLSEMRDNLFKACTPNKSLYDRLCHISDAAGNLNHIKKILYQIIKGAKLTVDSAAKLTTDVENKLRPLQTILGIPSKVEKMINPQLKNLFDPSHARRPGIVKHLRHPASSSWNMRI